MQNVYSASEFKVFTYHIYSTSNSTSDSPPLPSLAE